jgi:hypothetical protein
MKYQRKEPSERKRLSNFNGENASRNVKKLINSESTSNMENEVKKARFIRTGTRNNLDEQNGNN